MTPLLSCSASSVWAAPPRHSALGLSAANDSVIVVSMAKPEVLKPPPYRLDSIRVIASCLHRLCAFSVSQFIQWAGNVPAHRFGEVGVNLRRAHV